MYLRYNEQAFDAPPDGTPPRVQAAIDGIFTMLLQVAESLEVLEARVAALEAATPPTPPQEQQHDRANSKHSANLPRQSNKNH